MPQPAHTLTTVPRQKYKTDILYVIEWIRNIEGESNFLVESADRK